MDICKQKAVCEEFKRKRKETSCNDDDGSDGKDGEEECECRLKDLRFKCLMGALAALLAGGFVCYPKAYFLKIYYIKYYFLSSWLG